MLGFKKFKSIGQLALVAITISTIFTCADCCTSRIEFLTGIFVSDTGKTDKTTVSRHQTKFRGHNLNEDDPKEPPDKLINNRKLNDYDSALLASARSECRRDFGNVYCLNGGQCFNYTLDHKHFLPSCECFGQFQGERCERKYTINSGIYGVHPKAISLAKICIGSFLAGIIGSLIIYLIYLAVTHYHF